MSALLGMTLQASDWLLVQLRSIEITKEWREWRSVSLWRRILAVSEAAEVYY